ncbi:MAG: TetR family transcriptional regulator [Nitrospirales bacterium]|nr:TetR family transcriptional regulator [Nitrospira sp.]MDR4501482.1 TetR family transcriptional regulator [Nitrospirales bacterium]
MTAKSRDILIDTALKLFYDQGFHVVSVDAILAEAGISKPTLYKHFRSKNELILAALRRRDEQSRNWLMREMERRGSTPREQLLALFDTLGEFFQTEDYRGCMFINATVEFPDANDPINQAAAEHKRIFGRHVREIIEKLDVQKPDELAEQLLLLMEGAVITAHVSQPKTAALHARRSAEIMIDHALSKTQEQHITQSQG